MDINLSDDLTAAAMNIGTRSPQLDYNACPIFRLHNDILLEIFQINANMDEDPPLEENQPWTITQKNSRAINTTRNSSQVNSLWRDLIVNSPTMWADLIDLRILESAREYWREEVLRRTQNSPLHIKGSISLKALDDSDPWWLRFFNFNWTRMRKFDLVVKTGATEESRMPETISLDYSQAAKYRQALPFLARSTSTLESFRVVFPYLCDPLELGASLFDNHAPLLRSFQCQSMRFNPQNPWVLQLKSLHIHEHNGQTFRSVTSLCQILSQMPLLECLTIEDAIKPYPDADTPLVPINFPRLRYLNVRGLGFAESDTSASWNLLKSIIPRPDCSVRTTLAIPATRGDVDFCVLSRLAENYFKAHASTYLELSVTEDQFRLTNLQVQEYALVVDTEAPIYKRPFFDFAFYHLPDFSTPDIMMSDVFKALFSLSFPDVLELHLEVGIVSQQGSFSNPRFGELLSSFSSLEKLRTTPGTLGMLCTSEPVIDISTLFPQLKVLKLSLEEPDAESDITIPLPEILKVFLMHRKDADIPISTFEYEFTSPFKRMDDLTFLEIITDLRVLWKTELIGCGEYICGSGMPEELNFAKKWDLANGATSTPSRGMPRRRQR